MNAHSKLTRIASLFRSNRSQAVRIPKDLEFPEGIKKVVIRREGDSLVIAPATDFWTDFFSRGPNPDFPERFPQGEYEERLSFDD
jgi:antitoxin VapB